MKVMINGDVVDRKALWYDEGVVKFIDQRVLPGKFELFEARSYRDIASAISDMVVRGAPAIGVAAAYGIVLAVQNDKISMEKAAEELLATRPTAYDLKLARDFMLKNCGPSADRPEEPLEAAARYSDEIVDRCRKIGEHGSTIIQDGMNILTHCNAGALATVDFGTALAPFRAATADGKNIFVYVDETRPRLQGAKLTAWELHNESIPCAIIADNAAGYYMKNGTIDLVITGADRITRNGDAANKIGTYEKAVLAHENGIPFYIAAPVSTFDLNISSGDEIPIEERAQDELLKIDGVLIAPEGVNGKNPAFDVTPARYISGFITENGILEPDEISPEKLGKI
jgi:translation initiation factor eIF-2B subunit alpha/methylthioribose-1-phosphate isomerase